jgi:hypothetical protein
MAQPRLQPLQVSLVMLVLATRPEEAPWIMERALVLAVGMTVGKMMEMVGKESKSGCVEQHRCGHLTPEADCWWGTITVTVMTASN